MPLSVVIADKIEFHLPVNLQSGIGALAASHGRHSTHAMPSESLASGADIIVNVAEEQTPTSAELPTPRPWRPRGVRAGRRHKKRHGVSLVTAESSDGDEILQQNDSQHVATLAAEAQAPQAR